MMMMPVQKMNRVSPLTTASAVPTLPTTGAVEPTTGAIEPTTGAVLPRTTAEYVMDMTIEQEADGSNCCNLINLFRSFLIGLGSWVTCCYCCCGCCGNCAAHSGSVKYDTPEYKGLDTSERKDMIAKEHMYVAIVAAPVSCMTCLCCLGGCGYVGPMGVAVTMTAVCNQK